MYEMEGLPSVALRKPGRSLGSTHATQPAAGVRDPLEAPVTRLFQRSGVASESVSVSR